MEASQVKASAARGWWSAGQRVLGPGAEARIAEEIAARGLIERAGRRVLDVGCGPESRLAGFGLGAVGVDRSERALYRARPGCRSLVRADAAALPFASASFDSVWCFGLLHHLEDAAAARTLSEMRRVARPRGLLVVFDGVLPRSFWRRPLASLIRFLDRGRHMRSETELRALLAPAIRQPMTRFEYAMTGLEGLLAFGIVDPGGGDADS